MAVVNVKSSPITNADATPVVLNKAALDGARERNKRGVVLATSGNSIDSVYRAFRIRSNDLLKSLVLDNASWGAACTADIGLHQTAANGGAVVDRDLFASAVDMNAANRGLDVLRESGVITVANMEKRIWELLGLTEDPNIEYDVTFMLVAAAAATEYGCLTGTVVGGH